jgi:hypothetical protein
MLTHDPELQRRRSQQSPWSKAPMCDSDRAGRVRQRLNEAPPGTPRPDLDRIPTRRRR